MGTNGIQNDRRLIDEPHHPPITEPAPAATPGMVTIAYQVNRRRKGQKRGERKKFDFENKVMEIEQRGDSESETDFGKRIRAKIVELNPGWMISGHTLGE